MLFANSLYYVLSYILLNEIYETLFCFAVNLYSHSVLKFISSVNIQLDIFVLNYRMINFLPLFKLVVKILCDIYSFSVYSIS